MAEKFFRDAATRFQVYLERLKTSETRRSDRLIAEVEKVVRRALEVLGNVQMNSLQRSRFESLLRSIESELDPVLSGYRRSLTGRLRELNSFTTEFETGMLATAAEGTSGAVIVQTAAAQAWAAAQTKPLQAAGELMEPFIDDWSVSVIKQVNKVLWNGFAQGKTTSSIVSELRGSKSLNFRDGVLGGQVRRQTNAMVRTAIQHVAQTARSEVWSRNARLVKEYQWVSTLDARTTAQCQSLDGQRFEVDSGPLPPLHINCRSVTIPVISGIDLSAGRTRAARGAEGGETVSGRLTYFQWLKQQPAWFQDDALGATRGKLFRNGGLSAEEFARLNLDKNFAPLTLEEMRQKAPRAFERAGIDDI